MHICYLLPSKFRILQGSYLLIIRDNVGRISSWIYNCPRSSRSLTTRYVTDIFDSGKLTFPSGLKFEFQVIRDLLDNHVLLSNINLKRKSNIFQVSLWPLPVIVNAVKRSQFVTSVLVSVEHHRGSLGLSLQPSAINYFGLNPSVIELP